MDEPADFNLTGLNHGNISRRNYLLPSPKPYQGLETKCTWLSRDNGSMQNLLDYFGGGYLINLPHRTDRLRLAKRELATVGWEIGGPGKVQIYQAQLFKDRAGFPNAGARGCFDSHLQCLKRALAEGLPYALIIEDDIALASSLPGLSPSIIAQLDQHRWDFCYLGHELTGNIANADSKTKEVKFIAHEADVLTAHLYAVNARIIPKLLAHLYRVTEGTEGDDEYGPMPIDGAYNIFRRKNSDVITLLASPKLASQRSSRSDITPKFFDRIAPLHFLTGRLHELKYVISRRR